MNTSRTRNLGRIALFAALMAVCAWIVVPAPIPFTMQTFAIFLAAAVLGSKGGVIATMVYIALGVLGLPVFSGGKSGIGVLFGATGGYIIGFLPCVYIVGLLCEKTKKRPVLIGLSMLPGLLCDYIIGAMWYAFVFLKGEQGFLVAITTGILPFIIPDVLKIVLASLIAIRLQKIG